MELRTKSQALADLAAKLTVLADIDPHRARLTRMIRDLRREIERNPRPEDPADDG
jgi:hypothetical protein